MTKINVFMFLLVFYTFSLKSETTIPNQLTLSLGSISGSFAENVNKTTSTDGTTATSTPYSGSATSMPLEIGLEYYTNLKRSYTIKGSGPIVASTPDRYFNITSGMNFYFTQIGAEAKVSDYNFELKIVPKFRYYAGPTIGVGYLVYNTKSATKSDVLFEIGGCGGVVYTINPKWGIRSEVGAARAIGVLVSSTIIKILFGTTYNFGI